MWVGINWELFVLDILLGEGGFACTGLGNTPEIVEEATRLVERYPDLVV